MASSKRISPGTRRSSSGLFTRRPGDFLLGGGNEVGIDHENISRYQENISRSIHWETRRISTGTMIISPALFTRRPGDFLLGGGLENEVDIDQESISRYQESISWCIH